MLKYRTSLLLFLALCHSIALCHINISTTECGTSKGCFRSSKDCSQYTCQYLVTYRLDASKDYIDFEVAGQVERGDTPYVTMGIGDSSDMDQIYTIGCFWNGTAAVVQDGSTPKLPRRGHNFADPVNKGVVHIDAELNTQKSVLSCRFQRARDPSGNKVAKDLRGNQTYYLFAASGKSVKLGEGFGYHHHSKWVTEHRVLFSNYQINNNDTDSIAELLIKVHGSLMITAWMAIGMIGIVIALHYRITLAHTKLLGSRTWLKLHRWLQITASVLTALGFVIAFVAVGELRVGEGIRAAHPIIGIIVMSLVVLNILLVLSRRAIGFENVAIRDLVSTGHVLIGRGVFFLSAANVILGLLLFSQTWPVYLAAALVCATLLFEFALYLHARWHNRIASLEALENEASDHETTMDSTSDSAPFNLHQSTTYALLGNRCRITALILYASIAVAVAGILACSLFEIFPTFS